MGSVSMEYFLNLKYQLLQSSLSLVYLVKQDLQITVSFNKASFSIDIYQLPRVHCTNIDDLLHKLSAIYTLDTLLSKVFCSSHPLFSIRHLLKHSNLTVIGFHNQINVPARAFTKALYCHVKTRSIDLQFEYVQECEEFHNLIHQWHGFTPPLCSQFEGCVYISHDSVFLFYLPRQTNIPYILLFECIRNQFNEQNRVPMELSPHCLRPTQKVYPLISIYYYTDCHVKTESIDLILSKCAWQSTVECVYSLSKQLHFSNVDLCIQHLDTWMVKLDISLMICLFEVLHLDQMRNFEYIHSECTRFNKCVQKFIRVIPNTHYFTASVPFVFVSISSFQSLPQACKKKLTSCPTSAPLENVVYNEQQMQRMLKDYIYPYPIELHISYYGLEEDKSQVSTFVNSMKESFESVIKEITLNLFLAITPITNRMLDIILNDLNVLNKTEFLLSVLKSATISLIQSELERFEINGFTITRVDSYFLLFSESNSMSMNVLQTASELFMVSENEENPAMAFELNYNNNHVKKTPALRKGVSQKKRAWIILTVKPEALCVYSNVPHLRSIIGSMLPNLQRMINTRVLLNQLKDTHSSSRYLIPIHETVNSEEPHHCFNSLTKEDEEIMNASDGEFDCPVQFTTSFPLHWRLKFMEALKKVSASLDSLAVTNRAYTFVMVSPEGHVYYMILKEIGSCNLSLHFASNTTVNTECTTDSASFKTHTTTTNSSVSMSYTPTLRQLVIELYGLDPLSERFSNEVITMISSRLSKVVLHHLSIYLSRTDICKLTFPDVQFLFPIYCGPKVTYLISDVPLSSLDETSILFFRQSLLLFLSVLCSNDVIVTIQQHLQLKYNLFFTGNDECKVSPFDMIFSYCSISAHTTPNASESTLGSGIGCILFYVLQKNKICLQPTLEAPIYWCVEMWTHGILNTQALFEKIQHCQLQACHDAEVENDFKVNTSLTNLLLKLCQAPTDYYTCLNVHRWPIRIASWHTTHLMEYLETTLPDLPFQRGFNSCYCLSSCSELQNMCYYSNFVHSWSMNKWIKKKVDRHFLFFVEIQKEDILCVCWNISAVMLEKIQAGLKAYVEKYAQYIKELQQVTLFKMGLRCEIPSWYLTAMSNRKLCFQKWCPSPSLFSSVVPFNQVYHPHLEHKERDLRVTVTLLGNEDPLPSSICPKSKKPYLTNAELHRLLSQSSLVYSYRSPIFFHCTYHSSSFSFKGVELLSSFDFLKASMTMVTPIHFKTFVLHSVNVFKWLRLCMIFKSGIWPM
ncbi:hypothetical protein HMI55_007049 [Coelomomyces lativittatus]|nr:hypothetical protein HMI55_007049 [Coelomomyces lativittatus]